MVKNFRQFNRRTGLQTKPNTTIAKYPLSTAYNRPVYKKLARPTKKQTTKTGRNMNAIQTLARQVKTLQNQRFGEIQSHTQYLALTGNNLPTNTKPVAFLLNNFYDQSTYIGHLASGIASFQINGAFARNTYQGDIDDRYEWNARMNNDVVSLVEYKPVYTKLRINFECSVAGLSQYEMVRVSIIKVKAYELTNKLSLALPSALGAYRQLAEFDGKFFKNFFDKKYHTVMYDKWVKIENKNLKSDESTKIRAVVNIPWRYKDMVHRPDITSNPSNQVFWTNVPQEQQYWVLISTSSGLTGNLESVNVSKFDVWRDAHGAA